MDKAGNQIQLPQTLEECHQLIQELIQMVCKVTHRMNQLEKENQFLKERLGLHSQNSSLPPSSDHQKKKNKPKNRSSGRSSGGQLGHRGHFRPLLDTTEVDDIVYCELPKQCFCGGEIHAGEEIQRHQVYELPELKLRVTEYQLVKGFCQRCHYGHRASLPEGVSWGITGARLTSLMSSLVAKYKLSRREAQGFLKEHLKFSLSLGTVFNKQRLVNEVLAQPVKELLPLLKAESVVNMDETGHRQNANRAWMWVIATPRGAYYEILASRGKKIVRSLMEGFEGIATTDRYSVYHYFASHHRQLCWSHLKRDFTRISEKKDRLVSRIGKELLDQEHRLFEAWHAHKNQRITRDELIRQCEPIRKKVGECLEQCTYTDPHLRVARVAKNLLNHFNGLWTFLYEEGIEPTNNHAEQCLRPWVIWRKKYFGTRSNYGAEYVGRSASWITTCRLQSKSAFEYLAQAIKNHFHHIPAPPLIEKLAISSA